MSIDHKLYSTTVYLVALVCFFVPLIYIGTLFDKSDLSKFAFIDISSWLIVISWLVLSPQKSLTKSHLLFLLFIIYSGISFFWLDLGGYYFAEITHIISLAALYFVASQIYTPRNLQFIITSTVIGACISAVIGILQNFDINIFQLQQTSPPASTFINRNHAANYFDVMVILSFIIFLINLNSKKSWIFTIIFSINTSYLLLTHSRGSYLTVLIILCVFYWFFQKNEHLSNIAKKSPQNITQFILVLLIPFTFFILPGSAINQNFDEEKL